MSVFVSLLITLLASKRSLYPGIVLTSVDVKYIDKNVNPRMVEFCGRMKEDDPDKNTAVILKNIREVRREGPFWNRVPIFCAEEVSVQELKASIKKPLLCIHGVTVQPEDHLEICMREREKFDNFDLVPVIWPTSTSITNYLTQQQYYEGAGEAFQNLRKYAGMFPRKSLLAHSMGNRVLRIAADEAFMFDNIFMVGADVDHRIFNEEYIDSNSDDVYKEGLQLGRMLNNAKSKIYVLYNPLDAALIASTILTRIPRLGITGINENKLHNELKGKVENIQWVNTGLNPFAHGYQWQAIKLFESKRSKQQEAKADNNKAPKVASSVSAPKLAEKGDTDLCNFIESKGN